MYLLIAAPLLSALVVIARHFTTKLWFCGSTETSNGAFGIPLGVTGVATVDSGPAPAPLEAETLIEYLEPLVSPLIKQLFAVEGAVHVNMLVLWVAVAT
jgi:hypothetical protein